MIWQERAACGPDTAQLFDGALDTYETDTETAMRHIKARVICQRCPVRLACAIDADEDPKTDGIRAGRLYESEAA